VPAALRDLSAGFQSDTAVSPFPLIAGGGYPLGAGRGAFRRFHI
jgi:hypothetical protein